VVTANDLPIRVFANWAKIEKKVKFRSKLNCRL